MLVLLELISRDGRYLPAHARVSLCVVAEAFCVDGMPTGVLMGVPMARWNGLGPLPLLQVRIRGRPMPWGGFSANQV